MAHKEWLLDADVVRLGTSTGEPVAERRQQFHLWVAKQLLGRVRVRNPAVTTTYLPPDQARNAPLLLGEFLNLPGGGNEHVVAIIDCSLNHYEELGENILISVALCAANFAQSARHICIVLLPRFPHTPNSLFWEPLNELSVSEGTVLVVNSEGKVKAHGQPRTRANSERLGSLYEKKQQELLASWQGEFDDKIIRRMGHFEINDEYCSRYYFDGARTVRELSHLLVERVSQLVSSTRARTELIVPEKTDLWMGDAIALASEKLKLRQTNWPLDGDLSAVRPDEYTQYLIVLDFVNTGSTYKRIAREAEKLGYKLHRFAVAAFTAKDFTSEDGLPVLSAIQRVRVDRVARRECDQCQLGLPFTDKHREDLIGLRSYDAWKILFHLPWVEEDYGPPEYLRQKAHPNFVGLFEEFGDYLAYKLEMVLRSLVQGSSVAVACPEEPGILAVVKRMQPWADNRIVAVRIPRDVLEESDRMSSAEIRHFGAGQEWSRQLKHLAEQTVNLVLLDELNGSDRTARQMIKILAAFDLRPRAYCPIFNFAPKETLADVPVVALYDVPRPRRMD